MRHLGLLALVVVSLAACATPKPRLSVHGTTTARPYSGPPPAGSTKGLRGTEKPYQIKGIWYYPKADPDYDEKGVGSWYGEQFHNRRTANGELFDMDIPSAAHKTLPLPSLVEVTNLDNGKKMVLRVNDRGPFVGDRIIDLSKAAAERLGYGRQGVAQVRVRYIGPAPRTAAAAPRRYAAEPPPPPRPYVPPRPAYDEVSPDDPPPAPPRSSPAIYRIQAGSFSDRGNAERALARLNQAGGAVIESIPRATGVLYRVVVAAGSDENDAWGLRDRVVALGFADATVVRP
jgi:rare lipoprotein A